jgi:hypothetical protein
MNKTLTLVTIFTLLPGGLLAHHGTSSQFDASRIVEISGVVTDLGFVNPHSYVYLDVTTETGEVVNWHCEMRASSVLKRSGWTEEMFANGTEVDIVGTMSRAEDNGCYIETIAFNGGEPIERYAQIEENQLEPETTRPLTTAWGDPYIAGDWAANQRLVGAISGPNAAPRPPRGGRGRGLQIELSAMGEAAAAKIARCCRPFGLQSSRFFLGLDFRSTGEPYRAGKRSNHTQIRFYGYRSYYSYG